MTSTQHIAIGLGCCAWLPASATKEAQTVAESQTVAEGLMPGILADWLPWIAIVIAVAAAAAAILALLRLRTTEQRLGEAEQRLDRHRTALHQLGQGGRTHQASGYQWRREDIDRLNGTLNNLQGRLNAVEQLIRNANAQPQPPHGTTESTACATAYLGDPICPGTQGRCYFNGLVQASRGRFTLKHRNGKGEFELHGLEQNKSFDFPQEAVTTTPGSLPMSRATTATTMQTGLVEHNPQDNTWTITRPLKIKLT